MRLRFGHGRGHNRVVDDQEQRDLASLLERAEAAIGQPLMPWQITAIVSAIKVGDDGRFEAKPVRFMWRG